MHGVIGKDSLQYIVQIIASLVARQAAMAVQDTQITVFHESAVKGGGRGTVRRELLVFIRFTTSSFSPM